MKTNFYICQINIILKDMRKIIATRFVNPFTDIGFKIIFGQPASKDLLITLLNELLADEHHIEDLVFLDKEDHSENIRDKGIIYDLYCKTSTGEYIIVEMQNRWHSLFPDRTLYYMARAISRQIENPASMKVNEKVTDHEKTDDAGGSSYSAALADFEENKSDYFLQEPRLPYGTQYKLPTVYGIFLMNFKEPGLDPVFRTDTQITSRQSGKVVNPHFRQIYLQFPYFTKELKECESLYERLMFTLKNMESWYKMPEALKEQVFDRLEQLASVANLSEADRIAYDRAMDSFRVSLIVEQDTMERGIQQGLEKGRKEGRKKGLEEGRKEGLEKGLEKGRKEEKIRIARILKSQGVAADIISQSTGLTEEDIRSL